MAADDVAAAIAKVAEGVPANGTVEIAGPQEFRFDELIRQGLAARKDPRTVVVDPHARYFGAELSERALVPAGNARLGQIRFQEWLARPMVPRLTRRDTRGQRCHDLTRTPHSVAVV
jgi:uncharacterized protein YbjT (DUF2867 family)